MGRTTYAVLDGLYALHDELGSGGFGKVRLATHLLSSQKVAIKIIDKKAIGDDLPRVTTELDALKTLSHQNICRLYQYIETDEKFFIVLEYCSGGEMFDYIVKKERLEESEARHFFRQFVQAMAYVHSQGYAHRDLKPENLLLTEDLQLKLIDFGLCAKPTAGLHRPLETCCGSPAYAAPELIKGSNYLGHEADIWSMGVLLYALLCGSLPFEDENMQALYRKIQRGIYKEPGFLTTSSRELLRSMLQVDPKRRISITNLLAHPWVNKNYSQRPKWNTIYDRNVIDEDVARELSSHHGRTLDEMIVMLKKWEFDYLTATYFILLEQKRSKRRIVLPMKNRHTLLMPDPHEPLSIINVLTSPTIHASLESDLDRSGLGDGEGLLDEIEFTLGTKLSLTSKSNNGESSGRQVERHDTQTFLDQALGASFSPFDKNASYARAIDNMPSPPVFTGSSPKQHLGFGNYYIPPAEARLPPRVTPMRQKATCAQKVGVDIGVSGRSADDRLSNKENEGPHRRAATLRARGPIKALGIGEKVLQVDEFRRTVYNTPVRPSAFDAFNGQPLGTPNLTQRAASSDRAAQTTTTPCSPAQERTPRSATKKTPTGSVRQRMSASLQRKADRMFNLLTPRRMKDDGPTSGITVSMTSSKEPNQVRNELLRALNMRGIPAEQDGWKISGKKKDKDGRTIMTVELEVVLVVEMNGFVGVKRKRLNGDAFLYKKVCEDILLLAGL